MLKISLNNKSLDRLKPSAKPYFLRDGSLKGFGVKVNPTGTIKFVAEVWHNGRSHRQTLGEYPILSTAEARNQVLAYLTEVKSGQLDRSKRQERSLDSLFIDYTSRRRLKERTVTDYREAIFFYLSDWLQKPVVSITKQMVEERFYKIRDEGINGGKPTHSQATKTMRILSALLNYAIADELIESNPVQVLKLKRVDRSIKKRTNYLPAAKVRELLEKSAQDAHPVSLAVHLMIYSGLRKNEALGLKWDDIQQVEGVSCIIIKDPKNGRPHYVPVTPAIQKVLDRVENKTTFLFPSEQKIDSNFCTVRPTVKRLSKMIQHDFRCHDLRRTFATRASEIGIDYLTIKRLLNHKSNDITAQYIQWHSRENLTAMRDALEKIQY